MRQNGTCSADRIMATVAGGVAGRCIGDNECGLCRGRLRGCPLLYLSLGPGQINQWPSIPRLLSDEIGIEHLSPFWTGETAANTARGAPIQLARKAIKVLRGFLQFRHQLGQLIADTRNFPELLSDRGIARGFGDFETPLSFASVVFRITEIQRLMCSRHPPFAPRRSC
jgi:hypothetical protein